MTDLIELFLRSAFVDNLALAYFLGMCTFLAVFEKRKNCDRPWNRCRRCSGNYGSG